ncbi:hypothetical protein LENED_012240 [Lentinula edodes]|uniref:Uncharacterized protein n=1 Tax=Lentinula edodes TaxID=5353 RepID=A0A1Q3ES46_LENED|nr:uncharacterized protein C8R40DRAFT_361054 [Lentinula edodes]KAH7873831.1 hypothetical protein C8R40DRAFT_361054 [Lentinula edodes]KAJ3874605.1 hypothetical protein F5051DRAFT_88350 [Lentinula edodes]GAW10017.1 hypothetical protein LENED_012240 [Lentinula edodes]
MEFPQAHSQEPMMAKDQRSSPAHNVNVAPPPIPSSGYRIPLAENSAFPTDLRPLFFDADGVSPVFMGSAIFPDSVHPCKIVPALDPKCMVPYGGREHHHHGRYDLLPLDSNTMEFVRTSHGQIPHGRRPVEGGYEENGSKLYHGIATVNGVQVPGKTGLHLGGCNVSFAGGEHVIHENYDILCWKF